MAQISLVSAQAGHVPDLSNLLEPATDEGYLFVDRAIEEWRSGVNRFDRPAKDFSTQTLTTAPSECVGSPTTHI